MLVESVIGRNFRLAHWRFEVRAVAMTGVTDCKDVESNLWKGGNAEDPRVELESGLWVELQVDGDNADARGFLDEEFD